MDPSVSNSLLIVKISVSSFEFVVFRVNGKNELIKGIFEIKFSSVCGGADVGSSNERNCKSCCSLEILLNVIRLNRSIWMFPPFLISSNGIQR